MKFFIISSRKLKSKLINILICYLFFFIWCYLANSLLNYLNPPDPLSQVPFDFGPPLKYIFFMSCIFAPLWEELVFRFAPATIAKHTGREFLLPIMIISSAWFGWLHGDGPESIMRQGVMGFVFFWLYLKNGYSYWSSVVLHSLWNTSIFLISHKIW